MLRTYTEFMKVIVRCEDNRNFWNHVADEYCTYDEKKKADCKANADNNQKEIDELCAKYPAFGSMYKLNLNRKKAS
jgi:hypothetical protein